MRDPFDIIKHPRITEKSTTMAEKQNKYVLKVALDATKQEIKYAVKQLFKKDALAVNTMRVSGKKKRARSAQFGMTSNWKKAIVTLKAGDKIELV